MVKTQTLPLFCINLDRRKDRWTRWTSQPFYTEYKERILRVSAVDGATLNTLSDPRVSLETRARISIKGARRRHGEINSAGAVGCTLSHRIVWERFLTEFPEEPYALVLEDDVEVPADLLRLVSRIGTPPSGAQKAAVWMLSANLRGPVLPLTSGWGSPQNFWGTCAYLVNREGARVLLDSTLPIESHLDRTFCALQTLSALKIYLHRRINLVVFEDADTDIQGEPCIVCDVPDLSRTTLYTAALASVGAAILLYFQQLSLLFCFLLASVILAFYKTEAGRSPARGPPFPRRLLQTWKSTTDLPPRFHYWRSSWLRYHPTWRHDFWDDAANRAFVAQHFAWFLPTYDSYEKEICRADAVRYCYLYQYGGVYADMDFEALRSLEPLLTQYDGRADILLGSLRSGLSLWMRHTVPNALMISTPRQDFWLAVLKEMAQRRAKALSVEELTGPVVLRDVYKERQGISRIQVLSPETLYPISWITEQGDRQQALQESESDEGLRALTTRMKRAHPSSYTATYWTKTWA